MFRGSLPTDFLLKTKSTCSTNYNSKRWEILKNRRQTARKILQALEPYSSNAILYGSVVRGDVHKNSDVDIFIPKPCPSYQVRIALKDSGFTIDQRHIVLATPWHLPKLHYHLGNERMVTLPLTKMKATEREFYHFGGSMTLDELSKDNRKPGVNKDLQLINPTKNGHQTTPIEYNKGKVASILNINIKTVEERITVLKRRSDVGKTGVFIDRELLPNESAEAVFNKIMKNNSEIRSRP